MTRLAELRALLASRETRRRDHSRACSCLDCEHAQCVLEQSALEALPALLDVAEAAARLKDKNGIVCYVNSGVGRIEYEHGRVKFVDPPTEHDPECPGCALIAKLAAITDVHGGET